MNSPTENLLNNIPRILTKETMFNLLQNTPPDKEESTSFKHILRLNELNEEIVGEMTIIIIIFIFIDLICFSVMEESISFIK